MSLRYKGAVISATPPTTTGGESGVASGSWTLEQQFQAQGAGNWPTPATGPWIEDCFSTYLYTGNGSTQTITNGIDLSAKGGLTWIKTRSTAYVHALYDTARGVYNYINTASTGAQYNQTPNGLTAFNSNGFSVKDDSVGTWGVNGNAQNYVSWTFRKQPKFFDVQTFTSNSSNGGTFTHNLGAVPGCLIVKSTAATDAWLVWHRGLTGGLTTNLVLLNTTGAQFNSGVSLTATDTSITIPNGILANASSGYVAYLFAHDAGGFGLTGTDNVISCGSFTTDGSGNATVNLGYEPQWLMVKRTNAVEDWFEFDTMRGWALTQVNALRPNTSGAESAFYPGINPTATGFNVGGTLSTSSTYIYIAIRRGPMKVPTSGTSVFAPNAYAGGTAGTSFNLGFVPDTLLTMRRNTSNFDILQARLLGQDYAFTNTTDAYQGGLTGIPAWDANTGTTKLTTATSVTGWNGSGSTYVNEAFARAPGFFDVVCYTGTGANRTVAHNLQAVPELMIVKNRSVTGAWNVYTATTGNTSFLELNTAYQQTTNSGTWNNTSPTSSVFTVGTTSATNGSGNNLVAYLFATCAGVSKVGSYSGTGATQTIDCGFTGNARFVLIKRINVDGYDWYVWDTARGMVSGTDPSLLLNTSAAEVNANSIYTATTGFQIVSTAAGINASGGTYIFLAIA